MRQERSGSVGVKHLGSEGAGIFENYVLGTGSSFFADMSTEMLTPVLPIFLTQTLNANGSIVGLVAGVAQAVRTLGILPASEAAEKDYIQKASSVIPAGRKRVEVEPSRELSIAPLAPLPGVWHLPKPYAIELRPRAAAAPHHDRVPKRGHHVVMRKSSSR
jgi:hypothetical protein